MRKLITAPRIWTGVAVCGVALAGLALATRHSDAATIDCSAPRPDLPTVSMPAAALDPDDPYSDVSIQGELVDVESNSDPAVFTVKHSDLGYLTFEVSFGWPVTLDLHVGSDVTVSYRRAFTTTASSATDFALVDEDSLVFALQEGVGTRGSHPPFEVTNVTANCSENKYVVRSLLEFSAAGIVVRAAAGETATMSAEGRDYLVHTFYATEVISEDVYDASEDTSYFIARVPERDRAARLKTSREGDQ